MAQRFYHPSKRKIKYSAAIFTILSVLTFSNLVYSSCPAVVQCSEAEIGTNPLCTQACTANFNLLLLVVIILASYLVPAAVIHHNER